MIEGDARRAALLALRDLGVVRAAAISPGYEDLYRRCFADRTPAGDGRFDYRLSPRGAALANELFHKEF